MSRFWTSLRPLCSSRRPGDLCAGEPAAIHRRSTVPRGAGRTAPRVPHAPEKRHFETLSGKPGFWHRVTCGEPVPKQSLRARVLLLGGGMIAPASWIDKSDAGRTRDAVPLQTRGRGSAFGSCAYGMRTAKGKLASPSQPELEATPNFARTLGEFRSRHARAASVPRDGPARRLRGAPPNTPGPPDVGDQEPSLRRGCGLFDQSH